MFHIFQEKILQRQKVQQLKHKWWEPKQMMMLLWFLRKTPQNKQKWNPHWLFYPETLRIQAQESKRLCAQLKSQGYISGGEINHVFTHKLISDSLPSLPLTASVTTSALMALQSDRKVLSILWGMFSQFLNHLRTGPLIYESVVTAIAKMLSWEGAQLWLRSPNPKLSWE